MDARFCSALSLGWVFVGFFPSPWRSVNFRTSFPAVGLLSAAREPLTAELLNCRRVYIVQLALFDQVTISLSGIAKPTYSIVNYRTS